MAEKEVIRIKQVRGSAGGRPRDSQFSLLQLICSDFISAHGRAFSFSHPRRSAGQKLSGSSFTGRPRAIKELPKVSYYVLLERKGELSFHPLGF